MPEMIHPGQALYMQNSVLKTAPEQDWGWYWIGADGTPMIFGLAGTSVHRPQIVLKNTARRMPGCPGAVLSQADAEKLEIRSVRAEPFAERPSKLTFDLVDHRDGHDSLQPLTLGQLDRISVSAYQQWGELCPLLEYSGYYPTRLVYLIGNTHTGKTCFLNALRTSQVYDRLCALLPNGSFRHPSRTVDEVFAATQIQETHHQAFFVDDSKGNCKGIVYFVDISGEIASYQREKHMDDYTVIENIRASIGSYASALMVISNLAVFLGLTEGPAAFLRDLAMARCLPSHICYVQTETDLLLQTIQRDPRQVFQLRIGSNSEVFHNAADAPDPEEAILRHMAIAHSVMAPRLRSLRVRPDSACFMVSSCQRTQDRQHLDFSRNSNVELPAVWLTRQLFSVS